MLRKINKDPKYKIFLIEQDNLSEKEIIRNRLVYDDPSIEEELLTKEIKLHHKGVGDIKIKIKVNKATKDLTQHGDSRDGGLIIFFNEVAVLDCTLVGYDNHTYARNFFGEVELEGFERFLEKDEAVLSDERKGLDKTHPFVNELFKILNKELGILVKEEERKGRQQEAKKIESVEISRALGMINKIAQEEIGSTEIDTPPKEFLPDQFGFYFPYDDVLCYENKKIVLKINKTNVKEGIELESTNEDIEVSPNIIAIDKKRGDYQLEKINIFSSKPDSQGEIIAKTSKWEAKILVSVLPNPKIKEDEEFYFYPNNSNLIQGKKKEFSIIVKSENFKDGELKLKSDSDKLEYPKSISLKKDKMNKLNDSFYEIKIQLQCNHLGKNIELFAEYQNFKSKLNIEEILPPSTHDPKGLFKEIFEDRNKDPMEMTSYENGTIYIHTSNPVLEFFQNVITGRKDYDKFFHWRAIRSKIVAERMCKEIILAKDRKGNLPYLNMENEAAMKNTIEFEIKKLFFKYGKKFTDALLKREMDMINIEISD